MVTYRRYPYFRNDVLCELFIDEMRVCKKINGFKLFDFVIMNDHVHLLLKPDERSNISKVIHSLKRAFSRDVNGLIVGEVHEPRLLGEQYSFRFGKTFEVPNFSQFKIPESRLRGKFKWQKSFHDHIIRDEEDFFNHRMYIFTNPQRHGLKKDWRTYAYSSANSRFRGIIDELQL